MKKNLLLLLISCALVLLVLEVAVRVVLPQHFQPHPAGMYVLDEDIGYVLAPGFDGLFSQPDFEVHVHTNSQGLRGDELKPVTGNTLRILCIGDSFTWGWGVNDNEAYPYILGNLLQQHYPQLDIQVLNGGVAGYGTDEELEYLRKRGRELAPDIVIVQFFSGNDFDDNRSPASVTHSLRDGMLYSRQPGAEHRPLWLRAIYWLKKQSHLAHLVSERAGVVAMRLGVLTRLEKKSSEYFSADDAQQATDLLVRINDVATELGARTMYLFVPEKAQVLSGPISTLRAATVVKAAAGQTGSLWVDAALAIGNENPGDLYLATDAHWSARGHEWIANVLKQRIVENGYIGQ